MKKLAVFGIVVSVAITATFPAAAALVTAEPHPIASNVFPARYRPAVTAAGSRLFVFGGYEADGYAFRKDGALINPGMAMLAVWRTCLCRS